MNKKELIDFEKKVEELYKEGKIKGPIHLRDGNEDILIDIFKGIKREDYVFSTWANHLHALLKGVPQEFMLNRIRIGESMAMNYPQLNFYTSAIVGGILPIATGTAFALKKENIISRKVFCFIGDMTLRTGIAHESIMYSISHDLPIVFIIEDNGKSVGTDTQETWGNIDILKLINFYRSLSSNHIIYYKYKLSWPHSGTGVFVSF